MTYPVRFLCTDSSGQIDNLLVLFRNSSLETFYFLVDANKFILDIIVGLIQLTTQLSNFVIETRVLLFGFGQSSQDLV